MEKDYFLDRSYAYCYNDLLSLGDEVLICEKHMQTQAKELTDLTKGTIVQKLTNSRHHHMGIKVKIKIDNTYKTTASSCEREYAIGRVVYLYSEDGELLKCER